MSIPDTNTQKAMQFAYQAALQGLEDGLNGVLPRVISMSPTAKPRIQRAFAKLFDYTTQRIGALGMKDILMLRPPPDAPEDVRASALVLHEYMDCADALAHTIVERIAASITDKTEKFVADFAITFMKSLAQNFCFQIPVIGVLAGPLVEATVTAIENAINPPPAPTPAPTPAPLASAPVPSPTS